MLTDFNNLPEDARIWIYASETSLNSNQQKEIINILSDHLEGWNAHKVPLTAGVTILENHFIVVALDENKNGASGCSIDTLQQKVQEIEKEFSISLMNRLNIFCEIEGEIESIPSFKLKKIANGNTFFYDLTIQNKSELHSYLKPIKDGWCSKFL